MAITDPRDISGLVVWYSAEAETGYANGASMTQWTDRSGNGNHAVAAGSLPPQWESSTGPGGGASVKFRGTGGSNSSTWGYFSLPTGVMGSAASGEILVQIKSDGVNCSHWWFGPGVGGAAGAHYPYGSYVYETFGVTGSQRQVDPTVSVTAWRRYNVWAANNDMAARFDGTTRYTSSSATVSWASTPVIGHTGASSVLLTTDGSFRGNMSAVVLYNRKLTTTERNDLDAWLAANPSGGTTSSLPTVIASGSGAGTLAAATVGVHRVSASASGSGALAAVVVGPAPAVTASASGVGTTGVSVAPQPVEAVPVGTTLTRDGGRSRGGQAVATWEPPVAPAPSIMVSGEHRMMHAAAFGPVTMLGTQPTYSVSQAWASRLRTRILVGGKDISFFRGVPTPEPEYQLAEPLLWGPSSIELPQVAAAFETLGVGDLSWCAKGKPVVYQRVRADGTILGVDYRGLVIAHDTSGKTARLEVGGHGQGRATLRHKPGPIFRDTLDLGRLAWAAIRDLGLRFEPRMGPETGIESATFGNQSYLDHISEVCAKAWQRNGTQWTLMPDSSATYRFVEKDTTSIHWTVFNDDAVNVAALRSDMAEEPNRIFATGVTPKGQRVRFGVYPGLTPGPAAPYPFTDNRNFDQGVTDADTDTGDGITIMVRRLWTARYLSLEESDGTFNGRVTKAIAALQRDAGVTGPVGVMTPALWRALFDLDVTGYGVRGAQVEPAAETDAVRRWNRASSGQIMSSNAAHDPTVERVDRAIDFGSGFPREQMREWSGAEISRGPSWTGTITLNGGGVLTGDVPRGATIDVLDVADVRSIRPGHNVSLPMFADGIVVHVSGVEINRADDGRPVAVLTVDTQARDAMEVWEIIRRNRETRRDPARRWKGNRASGEIKDSIIEWDEIGGVLDGDRELEPGWNRVRVVGGQEGTVSRIKTLVTATGTEDGIEYAVAVFGKPMTAGRLDTLVPAPLGVDGDKKWRDRSETLERLGALYSAGTEAEPCGYGRHKKGDAGAELNGFHIDDAGFSYRCGPDHLLDVLVWVGEAATLRGGRIMRNQLEAGA